MLSTRIICYLILLLAYTGLGSETTTITNTTTTAITARTTTITTTTTTTTTTRSTTTTAEQTTPPTTAPKVCPSGWFSDAEYGCYLPYFEAEGVTWLEALQVEIIMVGFYLLHFYYLSMNMIPRLSIFKWF